MSFSGFEEENRAAGASPPGGGPSATRPERPEDVHDYLMESILVTLFCCQPFGIVALVYAAQVKSFLTGGFHKEALEASEKARSWSAAGFWLGLILIAVALFFFLIALMADID